MDEQAHTASFPASSSVYARMFNTLVLACGGVGPAAEQVKLMTGRSVSIGTFSRISKGELNVPLEWVYILEDFSNSHLFFQHRQQHLEDARSHQQVGHLCAIKEASEALAAIANVASNPSAESVAAARKEICEARAALAEYENRLDQKVALQSVKAAS